MGGEKGNCKYCQTGFVKKKYFQRYCSSDCQVKGSAVDQREKINGNKYKIFMRDGFKCFYCGKSSIEDDSRLVIDHVIPQSKFGRDNYENVVTSCFICNAGKSNIELEPGELSRVQKEIKRRNKIHGLISINAKEEYKPMRSVLQRKLQVRVTKPAGWYEDRVGECFLVADTGEEDYVLWEHYIRTNKASYVIGREDCVILAQQTAKL